MITWQPKDAADTRIYGIDWSPALVDGDTVSSVTFVRYAGTANFTDQTEDGNFTYVTVSGGNNGQGTKFTASMVTTGGKGPFNQVIWLPVVSAGCMEYEPSSTTKRTVVEMAYEDCGLPGYEFASSPEELFSGIRRLDGMMREWPCGQKLGYNFPTAVGQSDPEDPTLVPDWALMAMVGKLAQKLAPGLGKTLSNEQKAAAASSYSIMLGRIPIPQVRLPRTTPRGSGNRWMSPWYPYVLPATCCAVEITSIAVPPSTDFLLLQSGDALLLEDGGKILLEA